MVNNGEIEEIIDETIDETLNEITEKGEKLWLTYFFFLDLSPFRMYQNDLQLSCYLIVYSNSIGEIYERSTNYRVSL